MIAASTFDRVRFWTRRMEKAFMLLGDGGLRRLYRLNVEPLTVQEYARPWLLDLNIRTVIDVGANTGQFTIALHHLFEDARFHCFEPVKECFDALRAVTSGIDCSHYNVGVGATQATMPIFVHEYRDSSSLLPMADDHKEAFPFSAALARVEEVQVVRLDDVLDGASLDTPVLMKLDVQGGEMAALAGATELLHHVDIVIAEASFIPLYEGGALFGELFDLLRASGFRYAGNVSDLRHPRSGEVLQCDAIFRR